MKRFIFTIVAVLCTVCNQAHAGILTKAEMEQLATDAGFSKYRVVFRTSGSRSGKSEFYSSYNSFIATDLSGTSFDDIGYGAFSAIVSTQTYAEDGSIEYSHARDLTGTRSSGEGTGIYTPDGRLVASSYDDLWDGQIDNAIDIDQFGGRSTTVTVTNRSWFSTSSFTFERQVWTGTTSYGEAFLNRALGDTSRARAGDVGSTTNWIDNGDGFKVYRANSMWTYDYSASQSWHLYAISGEIELQTAGGNIAGADSGATAGDNTTVPEPSTFSVLGLLSFFGVNQRRRQRRLVSRPNMRAFRILVPEWRLLAVHVCLRRCLEFIRWTPRRW